MASLWYCAIGHGRAEMAEAIAAQAGTLAAYSCFDPFTNAPADELAEKLVDLVPIADARVFFCQSGSEAIDTAMKLARLTHVLAGNPQRTLIISRMRGYHGTNFGGTTAQGLPPNKEGWGPLVPDVVQVPSDDVEALAQLMAERSNEVAAVITEAGGDPTDLVSMTIYTTDVPDYRESLGPIGEAYRQVFGKHFPPMALIGVAELFDPKAKVELVCVAVVPA